MTTTHQPTHTPVHRVIHRPHDDGPRPRPHARSEPSPQVDVYLPQRNIRIDQTFWQHRSIFAGTQEQLDELRSDAEHRAAVRARAYFAEYLESEHAEAEPTTFETHRPAIRRLTPVVHVGFIPLLWNITTCHCGDRWPCNTIKQHLRHRHGWTVDITDKLTALTKSLPKPHTRVRRLLRSLSPRRAAQRCFGGRLRV